MPTERESITLKVKHSGAPDFVTDLIMQISTNNRQSAKHVSVVLLQPFIAGRLDDEEWRRIHEDYPQISVQKGMAVSEYAKALESSFSAMR